MLACNPHAAICGGATGIFLGPCMSPALDEARNSRVSNCCMSKHTYTCTCTCRYSSTVYGPWLYNSYYECWDVTGLSYNILFLCSVSNLYIEGIINYVIIDSICSLFGLASVDTLFILLSLILLNVSLKFYFVFLFHADCILVCRSYCVQLNQALLCQQYPVCAHFLVTLLVCCEGKYSLVDCMWW